MHGGAGGVRSGPPVLPTLVPLVRTLYLCLDFRHWACQPEGNTLFASETMHPEKQSFLAHAYAYSGLQMSHSSHHQSTVRKCREHPVPPLSRAFRGPPSSASAVIVRFSLQASRYFVLGALASSGPDLAGLSGRSGPGRRAQAALWKR